MSVLKQLKGITKRTIKYLSKDIYDVNSDKHLDEIIQELKNKGGGNKFLVNGKNYFDPDNMSEVEYKLGTPFITSDIIGNLILLYLNKSDVKLRIEATSEITYEVRLILDGLNPEKASIYSACSVELDPETEKPRVVVGVATTELPGNDDNLLGDFRSVIEFLNVEDLNSVQSE